MKKYKVGWKSVRYAESLVEAIDEEEAWVKAKKEEDEGFVEVDSVFDWEVYDVTEIK